MPLRASSKVSTYRRDVPASVYLAAKITASLEADCGACVQLVVSMAEAEGVAEPTLRALVTREPGALRPDERLGYELARATLARENADDVRSAIFRRWGRRALVSLAYVIVAARAFPTFKYAIGNGAARGRGSGRVSADAARFESHRALLLRHAYRTRSCAGRAGAARRSS